MKKILIFTITIFSAGFALSGNNENHANELVQLREILDEASRTSQKVFVEEFTGLN